jgi:hypothetical protein
MIFEDFIVGKTFFTETGEWKVVDKGQETVIAYNITESKYPSLHWHCQNLIVFFLYDFPACFQEGEIGEGL